MEAAAPVAGKGSPGLPQHPHGSQDLRLVGFPQQGSVTEREKKPDFFLGAFFIALINSRALVDSGNRSARRFYFYIVKKSSFFFENEKS